MYVRVPENIEEHLLRELKRTRVRSIIKLLPALILILALAVPLIVFLKGLHLIKAILHMASIEATDTRIFIATCALCFIPAMLILYFTLRATIKECVCHDTSTANLATPSIATTKANAPSAKPPSKQKPASSTPPTKPNTKSSPNGASSP